MNPVKSADKALLNFFLETIRYSCGKTYFSFIIVCSSTLLSPKQDTLQEIMREINAPVHVFVVSVGGHDLRPSHSLISIRGTNSSSAVGSNPGRLRGMQGH